LLGIDVAIQSSASVGLFYMYCLFSITFIHVVYVHLEWEI